MTGLPPDLIGETTGLPPDLSSEAADLPATAGTLYALSSFYSAALSEDGQLLAVDTGQNGIYQESEIYEIAESILKEGRTAGMTGDLLYQTEARDGYTLVAFMDITQTRDSMRRLLSNTLIAGIISAVALLLLAAVLARRIVRPIEENDRKQKQFISDAGHELKTPVSVIGANAEMLFRQIGKNEWLDNIVYENTRMGTLVQDLLDLSRAERASLEMDDLDLSRLLVQEVLPFESVAFEQGLAISSQIEEGITMHGSSRQIGQLISILMDNAISYGKDGREVGVSLQKDRKNAVLQVSNRGQIPEKDLERLFDRFYRADEARGSAGGHYGLGLSIAKAITEAHKGQIRADCKDGLVTFTVTFPVKY